jgi:hypothetical protein
MPNHDHPYRDLAPCFASRATQLCNLPLQVFNHHVLHTAFGTYPRWPRPQPLAMKTNEILSKEDVAMIPTYAEQI